MQEAKFKDTSFDIGGRSFESRLIVGTGKYKDFAETKAAVEESGAEIVTVAVRRVNITDRGKENLLDYLDPKRYQILPNTAGCFTAEEAIRTCRLAREVGVGDLVKLEVIGDKQTLFPDVAATIEAARVLVKEGFKVMPYITDDPVTCLRLQEIGCVAVMPLAAPIGSGLGIRNPFNLAIIIEQAKVPVIVDAGVGTASVAAARQVAPPGTVALQLREKDLPARELYQLALRLREICSRNGAPFFVNDRVDVAIAAHADGVHLPFDSI